MTEIVENSIWLGSKDDAENIQFLLRNKITHVINVCGDNARPHFLTRPSSVRERVKHIQYFEIQAADHPMYPILDKHGYQISSLMDSIFRQNPNSRVLIHCFAGINRSATLLINFLKQCVYPDKSIREIVSSVRQLRPIILSNKGFESQLFYKHR
jgi:protein-tyrosine phosphatase